MKKTSTSKYRPGKTQQVMVPFWRKFYYNILYRTNRQLRVSSIDQRGASRRSRLDFDGEKRNNELREAKMSGRLRSLELEDTLKREPAIEEAIAAEEKKNGDACAEMVHLFDNKSLSLIRRDAPNDGRKALNILKEYYVGKGRTRVINLCSVLSSVQRTSDDRIRDYIIKADTAVTALQSAVEVLGDGRRVTSHSPITLPTHTDATCRRKDKAPSRLVHTQIWPVL